VLHLVSAGGLSAHIRLNERRYTTELSVVLVGRYDDACRRYVIPNQLHVHGVRGAAEELFAFSKNYRTRQQ
jgi:hypothetical protein